MTYLRIMFDNLKNWFRRRSFFVICDPSDNSITFSKALFKHMGVMEKDAAKVYVFYIPDADAYGFVLNPQFDQETQLADIQYNAQHKTIGFECLVPTVNRIIYDYGLSFDKPAKLSVQVCVAQDIQYYKICQPKQ